MGLTLGQAVAAMRAAWSRCRRLLVGAGLTSEKAPERAATSQGSSQRLSEMAVAELVESAPEVQARLEETLALLLFARSQYEAMSARLAETERQLMAEKTEHARTRRKLTRRLPPAAAPERSRCSGT